MRRFLRPWLPAVLLAVAIPDAGVAAPAAGPLHAITIATNSLEETRLFYVDGLGMRLDGPLPVDGAMRELQRRLWHAPADLGWSEYALLRDEVGYAARIRLLVLDRPAPAIRGSWDPRVLGPTTIGFPNTRQEALDAHLRQLGFGALNRLERSPFVSDAGRRYEILETVHTGPDFVSAVGVARGLGEPPITPVDAQGNGGPGYSMLIVEDLAPMKRFMTEVVGWRVKSERVWKSSGTRGALNLPDGTEFDFVQVAPPDTDHGFLLFISLRNLEMRAAPRASRLPGRGIVLYSLAVADLDATVARARRAGIAEIEGPAWLEIPGLGRRRTATMAAPNGVLFELFAP
jgi:catechol 2,3-dioxygenase-like lactoylglutathione lyase family enzyme